MTPADEARRLLVLTDGNLLRALEILERQLGVLQTRGQVLLGLAGAVVTVTGFSGRLIAGRSELAQAAVVAGLALVLAGAVHIVRYVMSVRWVTQEPGDGEATLVPILERRNQRTQAYRLGGLMLCVGLALYGLAVAAMLLNPEPVDLTPR